MPPAYPYFAAHSLRVRVPSRKENKTTAAQKDSNPQLSESVELYAVLNALYSDCDHVLKKHGISNIDVYVDLAKAWIEDKDAVPNKALMYYECIVK